MTVKNKINGEVLTLSGNGDFSFSNPIASDASFDVSLLNKPIGLSCTLDNTSGTSAQAKSSAVAVACKSATVRLFAEPRSPVSLGMFYLQFHLTEGQDGLIYGISTFGGPDLIVLSSPGSFSDPESGTYIYDPGHGMVFRFQEKASAGDLASVQTLYSFNRSADTGTNPAGSLILARDGNFYGTNSGGLVNPDDTITAGAIFKMSPAGVVTSIYRFSPTGIGQTPTGSLVQAKDGNFYGMTSHGGAFSTQARTGGTMFVMTPSGTLNTLHSFGSGTDGLNPVGSLIQASNGDFCVL